MDAKKKLTVKRYTKIGVAVVIAMAMLYFGLNYLKGINIFTTDTYYYVKYDRVDGIVKTTQVNINGFKVGRVSNIIFDYTKEAPIIVELTVSKDLVIPKGTIAEIYETGLMGEKAIQLKLANNSELCVTGDTLTAGNKAGMVGEIINMIAPPIQALVPQLDSTLMALRRIAESQHIQNILADADKSVKNIRVISSKLNTIIDKDVPVILTDAKTISKNLSVISEDIAKADIDKKMASLDTTLLNIQLLTQKINSKDNSLGALLNDKELYRNIDSTILSANALLIDLKANPKRYVHFSVFGKKDKEKK